jgi:protein-disulfide isomerase
MHKTEFTEYDEGAARLTMPVSARDHIQGRDDAPLTLVEYGDYQCPYCGAAYPVVKRLQKTLGNKLRFVFRNFPLPQAHPYAVAAAEAAETAALLGKFWPMHDMIYENQAELSPESLAAWAHQLGLTDDKLEKALKGPEIVKRLKEDRSSGIRSGVNGTPTFYINGKRHDGAPDYESLLAALESELSIR